MLSNKKIARFIDILDRISQSGRNVPGLIMSSPGYGKTSTIELYCDYRDYNLTTLIASQYAPDDILGLQVKDGDSLKRLPPSWFNDLIELSKNGKRNILFIDELTTCDEFIQAPLLNLIFSQSLGGYKLPEHTVIIAAGNYSEELNGAFKLTLPLVNRFLILNLYPSDYNFDEVFEMTFDKIRTDEEIQEYLGLQTLGDSKFWDYDLILNFIKNNFIENRIISVSDNAEEGLLGFISIRSITYCMLYLKEYCNVYGVSDWVFVVGDTLGKDSDGYKISLKLLNARKKFTKGGVEGQSAATSLPELIKLYKDTKDQSVLELIKLKTADPYKLTHEDMITLQNAQDKDISTILERVIATLKKG